MPGLQVAADGLIYGCGGSDNQPVVFRYDRRSGRFETLGEIRTSAGGEVCFRTHDLEVVGNTIYVGETDNPSRTNYLWECRI
ncbi:MAG: hypothetical protein BWY73_00980 [candidate division TA06 bacterium ADurb.Bin417]|uniref:Kelch motif protein n=1 Tax=candidate division TA06 bacterium ADurb.Bin417 TaxID=1852828 RepID=A0A1V5MFA4_UNCT6|nr:MAG: hypothetical protein BWY73_00980 [candidate division TA06 bacterium ADurb.Bin417]